MTNVLLISENFLRSNFSISDNVQSKYLLSAIRQAQTFNFQQVVGTKLYEKLQDLVRTNGFTENDPYKELLDKAQLFIGYAAIAELCVIVNVKIDNIGLNFTSDENVEVLGISDMFQLQKYYIDKADYYKNILQRFILKNVSKYPEVMPNEIEEIYSNLYSAASCGVNLGGARGKESPFNRYTRYFGYDKP
jgi:hypothetical protein